MAETKAVGPWNFHEVAWISFSRWLWEESGRFPEQSPSKTRCACECEGASRAKQACLKRHVGSRALILLAGCFGRYLLLVLLGTTFLGHSTTGTEIPPGGIGYKCRFVVAEPRAATRGAIPGFEASGLLFSRFQSRLKKSGYSNEASDCFLTILGFQGWEVRMRVLGDFKLVSQRNFK